jgi:hypothetical protein
MIAGISLDNAFLLLIAVAGFWFTARFLIGPKRGAPGLKAMFGREKPVPLMGIGKDAIATLLADARQFVVAARDLRGLILAGPFVIEAAESRSTVTLVVLAEDVAPYAGKEWLIHWPYPERGHTITEHRIDHGAAETIHRLTLRGSPPIEIHFVSVNQLDVPRSLRTALAEGAESIDDPAGLAEKLRLRWSDQIRATAAKA